MNCCWPFNYCCPTYERVDETTELTTQRTSRGNNRHAISSSSANTAPTVQINTANLFVKHDQNVSPLFSSKFVECKTTPIPWLGSYHEPFPAVKWAHIFQPNRSTLQIIAIQYPPSQSDAISINLHHVLYPNYNKQGDPGENTLCFIDISNVQVNGERMSDLRQKVIVHDGKFSPFLEPLTVVTDDIFTVSAVIKMPSVRPSHLYHGIKNIEMFNVILPFQIIGFINEDLSIETITELLGSDDLSTRIQDFLNGSSHS